MAKQVDIWGAVHTSFPGRLNFGHIAKPGAAERKDGEAPFDPRYSATIIQKENPHTQKLFDEIEKMGLDRFGDKWKTSELAFRPYASGAQILKRYAEKLEMQGEGKEVSESMVKLYTNKVQFQANGNAEREAPACYVTVVGEKKPLRMLRRPGNDADVKAIEDQFYNGCWVTLAVKPHTYYRSDKVWGVALLFSGIKFLKDGDRLGAVDLDAAFESQEEVPADAYMDEVEAGFADEEGAATAENI